MFMIVTVEIFSSRRKKTAKVNVLVRAWGISVT